MPPGNAVGFTSCATARPRRAPGSARRRRLIGTAFVQDDAEAASKQWRAGADQLRAKVPKLAAIMDEAGRRARIHDLPERSSAENPFHRPLKQLNGEIRRRTDVVGIFPNEDAITRLIGACCWNRTTNGLYSAVAITSLETIAPLSNDPIVKLPAVATA